MISVERQRLIDIRDEILDVIISRVNGLEEMFSVLLEVQDNVYQALLERDKRRKRSQDESRKSIH